MSTHGTPPGSSLDNVAEAARLLNVDSAVLAAALLSVLNSQRNSQTQSGTAESRQHATSTALAVNHDLSSIEQPGETLSTAQDDPPSPIQHAPGFNGESFDLFDESWQNMADFDFGLQNPSLYMGFHPFPVPYPIGIEQGDPLGGDIGFTLDEPRLPLAQEQEINVDMSSHFQIPTDNNRFQSPTGILLTEFETLPNGSVGQDVSDPPLGHISEVQSLSNVSDEPASTLGYVTNSERHDRLDLQLPAGPSTTDHRRVGAPYPRLAAKPPRPTYASDGPEGQGLLQTVGTALVQRKPRSAYSEAARRETKATREMKSCVRCRTQRIRVSTYT